MRYKEKGSECSVTGGLDVVTKAVMEIKRGI
jgi:hypothetical protein